MSIDVALSFKDNDEEFLKFDRIENPSSKVRDLCAFLLLEKLGVLNESDVINHAEHDEVYLSVDMEKLAELATVEDIITLCRCGILYNSEYECLYEFV